MAKHLIWIDLEMTGLDPETYVIVEIASIVTDDQLNLVAEGPDIAINQPDARDHVHHAFVISSDDLKTATEHLTAHGVEILYSEDREGGTVNGPRTYFRDPDGTRLEFLDMTSYDPNPR